MTGNMSHFYSKFTHLLNSVHCNILQLDNLFQTLVFLSMTDLTDWQMWRFLLAPDEESSIQALSCGTCVVTSWGYVVPI